MLGISNIEHLEYLRLEGGAAADDGRSSSGSRDRFRRGGLFPRFAADMVARSGELQLKSIVMVTREGTLQIPHLEYTNFRILVSSVHVEDGSMRVSLISVQDPALPHGGKSVKTATPTRLAAETRKWTWQGQPEGFQGSGTGGSPGASV